MSFLSKMRNYVECVLMSLRLDFFLRVGEREDKTCDEGYMSCGRFENMEEYREMNRQKRFDQNTGHRAGNWEELDFKNQE